MGGGRGRGELDGGDSWQGEAVDGDGFRPDDAGHGTATREVWLAALGPAHPAASVDEAVAAGTAAGSETRVGGLLNSVVPLLSRLHQDPSAMSVRRDVRGDEVREG